MSINISVYLFIGPPSSGKSYLGKTFAEKLGYTFYEADDDYKEEYRERVKISKQEIEAVYEEFYNIVIAKTKEKYQKFSVPVVVASALGRERNRDRFRKVFGHQLQIIFVKSDIQQLIQNATEFEFPKILGVSELSPEKAVEISSHLRKKYENFEVLKDAIIIHNDYTPKTLSRLFDLLGL